MLYKENVGFILRSIQNTRRQCDHHVEFLDVKTWWYV